MGLFDQLPKRPQKSEPDVWVQRLVLLARLSPEPKIIRDIPLHRGLNIVWAEEPESISDPSDIAGHSAGKTTFCRLLRYVLGEKTYANKSASQAIRRSFPNGYVGAQVVIKGVCWAVLRPLGENRNSWIRRDSTVEEIIEDKGEPAYQESYPKQIGLSDLLDGLASATVVRTQEEIRWGHILAWCARDQEARFQNVYEWRSPRSDSEWPAFRFPKSDPLFVMRVLLGLYLRDELGIEEVLSRKLRQLERAEQEFERLKREPEFWSEHYRTKLKAALKTRFPEEADEIEKAPTTSGEILLDLKRYVAKAVFLLQEEADHQKGISGTDQVKLNQINERLAELRLEQRQIEALFALGQKAASEIQAGLSQDSEFRRKAEEMKHRVCPLGGVIIGECSHVRSRQDRLEPGELQKVHSLEQMEAERATERELLVTHKQQLTENIRISEAERDVLLGDQRRRAENIHALERTAATFQEELEQLIAWEGRVGAPEKTEKLRVAAAAIEELRSVIDSERSRLDQLLAQHDSNRDLLNKIFSESARRVLPSANYDGEVSFEDRELNFQITHGDAMSGEAVETLAVLLADLSCLIFNLLSDSAKLPGFLVHDSPREADLGLRHYHRFIEFVAEVAGFFEKSGDCPFQYVLTTTTPPPGSVINEKHIVLRLDASLEDGLLFRRNLSRPPEDEQLTLTNG